MVKYQRKDEWNTPKWVTDPLGFFHLDPCAGTNDIAKVNYRYPGQDGLRLPWTGAVWCNPPFSEKMKWFHKMKDHGNGILLLTDRTSAPWFGEIANFCRCFFLMGKKINFEGSTSCNPLGSVLFPFGDHAIAKIMYSGLPGLFVEVKRYNERT